MKRLTVCLAAALVLPLTVVGGAASAKGCIKGAIVGGVAGHYAHHHALLGAAAGCAVGHHLAHKHEVEQRKLAHQQQHPHG